MRSLQLVEATARTVHGKRPEACYTRLAVRPEELDGITTGQNETVYLASERPLPDGGVEIQIFVGNAVEQYENSARRPLSRESTLCKLTLCFCTSINSSRSTSYNHNAADSLVSSAPRARL